MASEAAAAPPSAPLPAPAAPPPSLLLLRVCRARGLASALPSGVRACHVAAHLGGATGRTHEARPSRREAAAAGGDALRWDATLAFPLPPPHAAGDAPLTLHVLNGGGEELLGQVTLPARCVARVRACARVCDAP
jgi:hypothetical protein